MSQNRDTFLYTFRYSDTDSSVRNLAKDRMWILHRFGTDDKHPSLGGGVKRRLTGSETKGRRRPRLLSADVDVGI